MTELHAVEAPLDRNTAWPERLLHAWLLCGVVDLLWAIVLTILYGRSLTSLFQGIAGVAFGPAMREAGWSAIPVGLAVHFFVAFGWSALFLVLVRTVPALRRLLASPRGVAAVAAVYGPLIWVVMSGGVIPALTGRPLSVGGRWWIQLAGHAVFVGLPIVWAIGRPSRRATE